MGVKKIKEKVKVVNITDKRKSKVVVKKKPAIKKKNAIKLVKTSFSEVALDIVKDICESDPLLYCMAVHNHSYMLIFKKIAREVKLTNTKNIFMIFEQCQHQGFIIPILIKINPTVEDSPSFEQFKDFGMVTIYIKDLSDVERQLNEIN